MHGLLGLDGLDDLKQPLADLLLHLLAPAHPLVLTGHYTPLRYLWCWTLAMALCRSSLGQKSTVYS